jgi:hypothetical protein
MADSQVPWGVDALGGSITEPAWRIKPSWYRVATEDRMIPPPAQRVMSERAGSTVVEVSGSHAIYVSQPAAVAALIEQAAAPLPCAAVARRDGRFAVEWSRMPGWPVPQERLISGPPKVPHELGRFDCEVTGRHGKLQRRKLTDGVHPCSVEGTAAMKWGRKQQGSWILATIRRGRPVSPPDRLSHVRAHG